MATVEELLGEAALGRIGVDRRLIRAILDQENAAAPVAAFARGDREKDRVNLDPLMVDLFRHFKPPEAIDFYVDVIRRAPEDVDDVLIQALIPYGESAIGPLISLYQEVGEEEGSDVAFVLAGLRIHDPRVLALLLDRLEFDASDGAFCLGMYGDPAARPELERILLEVPKEETDLRREIEFALAQLESPAEPYEPEEFDLFEEYPEVSLPAFDVLTEGERLEMLASADPLVRAGAAYTFFNTELDPAAKAALLAAARSDPDEGVRARAWESLADVTSEAAIRESMIAVLNDTSLSARERGGAAVGLYGVADRDDVRPGIEALYEAGGLARAKALEAMWRSLWKPYARYFAPHLKDTDIEILRQAIRGAGYFRLTAYADRIASFFDRDDDYADLREDALFAYALAMPGETTRGRARGMLRKIDSITKLKPQEADLVMFALDERLRLHGLDPVFESEDEPVEEASAPADPGAKPGRNDPCPCGSGKKFKKCHGAPGA